MTDEDPDIIACWLDLAEQRDLMAAYGRLASASLLEVTRERARLVMTFRRTPVSEAESRRILAIERLCCPFMDVAITETDGRLVLTYSGGDVIGPVLDMIEERLRGARGAGPEDAGGRREWADHELAGP